MGISSWNERSYSQSILTYKMAKKFKRLGSREEDLLPYTRENGKMWRGRRNVLYTKIDESELIRCYRLDWDWLFLWLIWFKSTVQKRHIYTRTYLHTYTNCHFMAFWDTVTWNVMQVLLLPLWHFCSVSMFTCLICHFRRRCVDFYIHCNPH